MAAAWQILEGDCRDVLPTLAAQSVHAVVTSPPYFGLRDYGTGMWEGGDAGCLHAAEAWTADPGDLGPRESVLSANAAKSRMRADHGCACGARRVDQQIGMEPTPDEFVAALVGVFREVRRVLRDDGTAWLNLGDSYATRWSSIRTDGGRAGLGQGEDRARHHAPPAGFKSKDLLGIPWMVAFALRADGWFLRSEIIWHKPNPMPESVTDRPTKAHEQVFLLAKSPRYFYDADAIREAAMDTGRANGRDGRDEDELSRPPGSSPRTLARRDYSQRGRNKRSVWTVATHPYAGAHFATFPPALIEPCILAGCPASACSACGEPWRRLTEREFVAQPDVAASSALTRDPAGLDATSGWGDTPRGTTHVQTIGFEPGCECDAESVPGTVLDPFAGACTTGMVALRHGRSFVGVELSPEYAALGRERIIADSPLLNTAAAI